MLVKASIAAAVLIAVAVPLSRVDYRDQYNEMYPVNGLKRDVLDLCHEAEPTFVRAIRSDRVDCYDSMPDAIELAIGWVRTSNLAALRRPPTEVEVAEKLLVEATMPGRRGLFGPRHFTGYVAAPTVARPCQATALTPLAATADPPLTESDERLARRIAQGDDPALAALGLAPRGMRPGQARDVALPALPLLGATAPAGSGGGTASRADPVPSPDLGDSRASVPTAAAWGCRTPA